MYAKNMHRGPGAIVAALAVAAMVTCAWAEDAPGKPKPKPKPEYPPVETVLKDTTKIPVMGGKGTPFMTLHHNAKTDDLFLEVPKKAIGKEFLLASSIAGGGTMTGFQWGTGLCKWEKAGKSLLLIEPEVRHLRSKSTVKELVEVTYPDSILRVLPIKALTSRGDAIVDFGSLLKSDFAGLSRVLGGRVRADLSRFGRIKNFEKNTEIPVRLAVLSGASGSRGTVHFSFSALPSGGYKSRVADDRIGYFGTVLKDWSKDHDEKTSFVRYINRWNLEKQDPSLELSPPKEPIVFYIEKTVPVPFRRYVKEGILEWNKAFEKCGYIDAMVVRQQTDTQFQDLDPEDVRYNFFRWIVSGRAFAMGPSRVNPRTGQILDADIIMDDSFVRYYIEDYERATGSSIGAYEEHDPRLASYLESHPEWQYESRQVQYDTATSGGAAAQVASPGGAACLASLATGQCTHGGGCSADPFPCQAAEGMVHQINLLRAAMMAKGKTDLPLEYLGQLIKEVVMHEVGHTLGLRHNFKASAWKTMDEIIVAKGDGVPTVASVMDYNGAIFTREGIEQGNFTTTGLGPYDHWAIGYGYASVTEPHKSEAEMLKAICGRSAEPGHAYATDEDTSMIGPDPLINRYDMSSDNIEFAKHQFALTEELLEDIESWAVEDGESWSRLRRTFNMLVGEYGRMGVFVGRYVGGQLVSRSHKGDEGAKAPIEVVSAEKQREAVDFVCSTVFADESWEFAPELLSKLAAGRWSHWDSDDFSGSLEYDLHDRIARMQSNCLMIMMNSATLNRLYDSRTKVAADTDCYTVPEHFEKLTGAIWGELDDAPTGEGDYVSSIRRGLQRRHLRAITDLVLSKPGAGVPEDVNALARITLGDLAKKIQKRQGRDMDAFTRAHLADSVERIERALSASYELSR